MAKARIGPPFPPRPRSCRKSASTSSTRSEVLTPADEIVPHRQARLHYPVRLRRPQPRRSPPPHRRSLHRHDPHQDEPGTGDVVHAVQHMRQIVREIRALTVLTATKNISQRRQGSLARPTNSSTWSPRPANSPCPTSPPAASRLQPTRPSLMRLSAKRPRLRRLHLHEGTRHPFDVGGLGNDAHCIVIATALRPQGRHSVKSKRRRRRAEPDANPQQ